MIYGVEIELGWPDDHYSASTYCYKSYPIYHEYDDLYCQRALTYDSLTIFKLINLLERIDMLIPKLEKHDSLFKRKKLEELKICKEKIFAIIEYYKYHSEHVKRIDLETENSIYYIPHGECKKYIRLPSYKSKRSYKKALRLVDSHDSKIQKRLLTKHY